MFTSRPSELARGLALALGILITWSSPSSGQEPVTLTGTVVGPTQQTLPETTVRVYGKDLKLLGRVKTNALGSYSLQVPAGDPIVRVIFDNLDFHVRTVEGLSARPGDRHEFNKVLFSKRGPKTFELIVDQILTYDRLRIVAEFEANSSLNRAETEQELNEREKELQKRLRDVYGERVLNIPHPLRQTWRGHPLWNKEQYDEQRAVVNGVRGVSQGLTPLQQNVVDRLMGDLLYRFGYTQNPVYERGVEGVQ